MKIDIVYRDDEKEKKQVVAFYCEEPELKKMVRFIKLFEKSPLCYSYDDLSFIQAFFEGSSEEIRQLVKDLKSVECSFKGERK